MIQGRKADFKTFITLSRKPTFHTEFNCSAMAQGRQHTSTHPKEVKHVKAVGRSITHAV